MDKMKKLMFAAFAAAGLTALAVDSNIVGYLQASDLVDTSSKSANAMGTPTFVNVGDTAYSIQDIIPVGDNVPNGSDGSTFIELRKLTSTAQAVDGIWCWMDYEDEFLGEVTSYYGWYDMLGETKSSTTFAPGEGFWAGFPKGASANFRYSGQVKNTDAYFTINKGNTAMGNPFPYDVNVFTKIVPVGSNVPDGSDGATFISLRKLTGNAQADGGIWCWMNYEDEFLGEVTSYYGWYDMLGENECPYDLTPGKGIWVNSPVAGCQLQFKHTEL